MAGKHIFETQTLHPDFRLGQQAFIALNRIDKAGHAAEHSALITTAGADLQHAVTRSDL